MEKLSRAHLAGHMPIPTAEQLAEALENVGSFHDMSAELIAPELLANLLAAPASPTVKAEQPDCVYCQGHGDVTRISGQTAESYAEHNEECPECKGTGLAPSLPAAGSADVGKFSVQCGVCKESSTLDDRKELSGCCWACGHEIDLDSQLRAALSAHQSAPELVSVPRELVSKLVRTYERSIIDEAHWTDMDGEVTQLRALLAGTIDKS